MTYQQPTPNYDNADESSLFLTDVAASSSSLSLGQEEAIAAKKQKRAHILCVAGIMLLVAAGRYSAGAATAAATATATGRASSNSIASVVSVPKDGKFYTCEKAVGTFQQRSCVPKYSDRRGSYYSVCVDSAGESFFKSEGAAETCFGLGSADGNRCWTKYHYISDWSWESTMAGWMPCVPKDTSVYGNPPVAWQYAKPRPDGSCGKPCDFGFTVKFPPCYWCDV